MFDPPMWHTNEVEVMQFSLCALAQVLLILRDMVSVLRTG